jgi:hypothetical protein
MAVITTVITHATIPMVTTNVVLTIHDAVTIQLVITIITIIFTAPRCHLNHHHYC